MLPSTQVPSQVRGLGKKDIDIELFHDSYSRAPVKQNRTGRKTERVEKPNGKVRKGD